MNISKITNITSGGINGMNSLKNNNIDKNEQKIFENIKKEIIKRTKKGEYLYPALDFADNELRKNGLENKYYYHHCPQEKYKNTKQKIFDDLNLNICENVIDTFEVYDRYNSKNTTIFLYKYCSVTNLNHPGEKEIPVDNIELAYKDVEKLAKIGYGDSCFINIIRYPNVGDSIPLWPECSWWCSPTEKLYSHNSKFRKFGSCNRTDILPIEEFQEKLKQTTDPEEQKKIKAALKVLNEEEREFPEELEP